MTLEYKKTFDKYHIDLFFLFIFLLTLPISGVTAIQNISFLLFLITHFMVFKSYNSFKDILEFKTVLILFGGLVLIALLSVQNSIDIKESISEIRAEIIKPFIYLMIAFVFVKSLEVQRLKYLVYIVISVFIIHTLLNIGVWIYNGGWPVRTGAFLDGTIIGVKGGAAERFGIWVTFSLSLAIALFFTKYKKIAWIILIISLVSIVANNTRATFLALIFIMFSYFLFIYQGKKLKFSILIGLCFSVFVLIYATKDLEKRYNFYNMFASLQHLNSYTPSEFKKFEDNHALGHSVVSRLSMWKSIILYRLDEPFKPRGYGRMLYKADIQKVWSSKIENIPYVIYGQAHNDFLSMLFSLGFIGMFLFIGILFIVLRYSYLMIIDSEYKPFAIFIFLGTVGYIGSMSFGSFFGDSEQLFFFLLFGALLAFYSLNNKVKNEKS